MTAHFRFPAEWEKQEGILLCFPQNGNDWPGKYDAIRWAFVELIKKVAAVEKVFLVVASEELQHRVGEWLSIADVHIDRVQFIIKKTNRSWMRDAGPLVVKDGKKRVALQFQFNGWAKYNNYHLDKHVPVAVADHLDIPLVEVSYKGHPVTLEGGAIDVNGRGTLLTTEECLLDEKIQVRNPGFKREDYENVFSTYLGITNVIWLGKGIVGDDTHGHIDDLARFVASDTIVTVMEPNKSDKNYQMLHENRKLLSASRLENGKQPHIMELPMPRELIFDGMRLPASYANFLIVNSCVLVPVFNDPNDRIALNLLAECFPSREIIPVGAIDLIWGFGTLHCLSQQIPK